ncbi:MAG: hypothetical protein ACI9N9_001318 [Enterobacterales bacterium]|jgi:hypothetical protein
MHITFFTLIILIFLSCNLSQGAENDSKVAEAAALLEPISENIVIPLNSADDKLIESPIVAKEDKHGQLFRYAYDAKHLLFPVKIISIDDWLVTDLVSSEVSLTEEGSEIFADAELKALEILLAPGEYQMKVIPDFENIQPQTVFMGSFWQEKHITFSITEGQQLVVAARLLNVDSLEWALELYRVEIPLEVEGEGEVPKATIDALSTAQY